MRQPERSFPPAQPLFLIIDPSLSALIVGFKGEPIGRLDDLHRRLVANEIGVTSPLTILRLGEKLEMPITPGELRPVGS
ncbi:MAG TPA: hypothetical protein PLX89_03850 [Verrucomicrobiota bacterium]|nr:hypothetical protein [Verrucomicrobiales bacterium]HRI12117.1 hypothetical protein [Verrucomicrobiota bacterium]